MEISKLKKIGNRDVKEPIPGSVSSKDISYSESKNTGNGKAKVDDNKYSTLKILILMLFSAILFETGRTYKRNKGFGWVSSDIELISLIKEDPLRDIMFDIPIYLSEQDGFTFSDLHLATQIELDAEIEKIYNKKLNASTNGSSVHNPFIENYNFRILDHEVENAYQVKVVLHDEGTIHVDNFRKKAYVYYPKETLLNNDLPFLITQTILYHFFGDEFSYYLGDDNDKEDLYTFDPFFKKFYQQENNSLYKPEESPNHYDKKIPTPHIVNINAYSLAKEDENISLPRSGCDSCLKYYVNELNMVFKDFIQFNYNSYKAVNTQHYFENGGQQDHNNKDWTYIANHDVLKLLRNSTNDYEGTINQIDILLYFKDNETYTRVIDTENYLINEFQLNSSIYLFNELSYEKYHNSNTTFNHHITKSTFQSAIENTLLRLFFRFNQRNSGKKPVARIDALMRNTIVSKMRLLAGMIAKMENGRNDLLLKRLLSERSLIVKLINSMLSDDDEVFNYNNYYEALNHLMH